MCFPLFLLGHTPSSLGLRRHESAMKDVLALAAAAKTGTGVLLLVASDSSSSVVCRYDPALLELKHSILPTIAELVIIKLAKLVIIKLAKSEQGEPL